MRSAIQSGLAFLIGAGLVLSGIPGAFAQQSAQQGNDQSSAPVTVPAPSLPPQVNAGRTGRDQTPTIRTSSDLVRIDVQVTDRSGKPVKGLKKEQFVVTDNDKQQSVSIFTYEDIEAIETAGEQDAKPIVVPFDAKVTDEAQTAQIQNRRMMVLFFDLTSMQPDEILRARDAGLKFIRTQMSRADLVAVVFFGVQLSVISNFTNDKDALVKAVNKLTPGVESALADNLYAAAQNGEADIQEYTGDAYTADETEFNVFNTDRKLAAIEGIANSLQGIPGRKSVVQFTSGITQTGEENRTELEAATDAANRADVSIYSVDSRALFTEIPGGDATTDSATGTAMFSGSAVFKQVDSRQDSRDTLATLSSDTGGKAFFDVGDLSGAIKNAEQDTTGYYLLGYYLDSNIKRDGKWRDVRVKVTGVPGAHVRFRNGYYAPKDFEHFAKEDREQQLEEAMQSQSPYVDLPIAVEASMFRLNDKQLYVPIAAKISSGALEWAEKHDRREADFDFLAEVRTYPSGQAVASLRDNIRVRLDPQRFQEINQRPLVYQGGVVLSPGRYRMKFIARENESGKIGSFEEDLVLPPLQQNRLSLSSVMLSSQLVPVADSPEAQKAEQKEVQAKGQGLRAKIESSPLEVSGEKIIPSVTRFFNQQQTLYVFFQAYYPEKFDPHVLRAGLVFFRGGLQINSTPVLAPTAIDEKTRTASFRISLPLSKLPTGRYTVQALVIGAGTQDAAFGRAYLALQAPEVASVPAASTPDATPARPQ